MLGKTSTWSTTLKTVGGYQKKHQWVPWHQWVSYWEPLLLHLEIDKGYIFIKNGLAFKSLQSFHCLLLVLLLSLTMHETAPIQSVKQTSHTPWKLSAEYCSHSGTCLMFQKHEQVSCLLGLVVDRWFPLWKVASGELGKLPTSPRCRPHARNGSTRSSYERWQLWMWLPANHCTSTTGLARPHSQDFFLGDILFGGGRAATMLAVKGGRELWLKGPSSSPADRQAEEDSSLEIKWMRVERGLGKWKSCS